MVFCLSRSSTRLIADSFLLDVRNAVQLAVYDWVTINAKNHHIDAHTRVEKALKRFRHVAYINILNCCRTFTLVHTHTFILSNTLVHSPDIHVIYLGNTSLPWHNMEPSENHRQLIKDKEFSSSSGSEEHGWGFCHSLGVILLRRESRKKYNHDDGNDGRGRLKRRSRKKTYVFSSEHFTSTNLANM